jgi:predicted regulator of Ras-like GTPase activity (Roadblock/LC7/MglB family)
MTDLRTEAASFSWLLEKFVSETVGVTDTIAVSSDGLLLAAAMTTKPEHVDRFAALVSGMNSLTRGAADCFDQDDVIQVVIELSGCFLFIARISEGSCLGVVAERACDVGLVAYEMTMLVDRAGKALTPALIRELQNQLIP